MSSNQGSPVISFRVHDKLHAEIARMALSAGMSISEFVRSLIEEETGVKVEMKAGMASASERTRKRVERSRLNGINERSKKSSSPPKVQP